MAIFSVRNFLNSLVSAGRGLKYIVMSEQNFRAQIAISLVVLILTIYFPLRVWEIILVILLIMSVLIMEILNTAFEFISDLLKPRLHHYVGVIKDIMAGAVLLTAVGAGIIGLIIFVPYFLNGVK